MKLILTLNKKNVPVEIDTDTVQLITPMEDGSTRIVTRKDVYYVKEDLDAIALIRAGIKDPGALKKLKTELCELQNKLQKLGLELENTKQEYIKKDHELSDLLEKAQRAQMIKEETAEPQIATVDDVLNMLFR